MNQEPTYRLHPEYSNIIQRKDDLNGRYYDVFQCFGDRTLDTHTRTKLLLEWLQATAS